MIVCFLDIQTSGIWRSIQAVEDPELKRLAHKLPATIMGSRANATVRKYLRAFQRWRRWAIQHKPEITVYPIQDGHFALYLQHLAEFSQSKASVEEAVSAAAWVQQLADHPPVSSSPFIRATLSGLQRRLARPKARKEPITVDILRSIVDSLGPTPKLSEIRLAAAVLLAFAAFLRYDEMAKLRCCDIKFSESAMSVHICSSKTDQFRQGDTVLVARTNHSTCPVAMMEKYVAAAGITLSSELRLFRGVNPTSKGEQLRPSGGLSYTRMRELFLAKLDQLGYDRKQFGLHSLRAGGATAAAAAGIPDRLFKRHGRWRSETAKDGYVKDPEESRLAVSKGLNL